MPAKVRKQFLLNPELLSQAREALKAKTDTETVELALRRVAIDRELEAAHAEFVHGGGELDDFDEFPAR